MSPCIEDSLSRKAKGTEFIGFHKTLTLTSAFLEIAGFQVLNTRKLYVCPADLQSERARCYMTSLCF